MIRKLKNFRNLRVINKRTLHNFTEVEFLKKFIAHFEVDCIFDVGANEGQYALQLLNKVNFRGRIISFEPTPSLAEKIAKCSKGIDSWEIEQCALSSENGTMRFNEMNNSRFNSLNEPLKNENEHVSKANQVTKSIEVPTETLESCFNRLREKYGFKRPFLKMDTQGHDTIVFKSGGGIVKEFVGLQSELAFTKLYEGAPSFEQAIALYRMNGYELSGMIPNNAGHFPFLYEMDCVMVNKKLLPNCQ
jgi:FkbM family methyltransferase